MVSARASSNRVSVGSVQRDRSARSGRSPSEDSFDQGDVPAAVVCAVCGDAECPGCQSPFAQSGIVAMVPWERNGAGWWARLWATTRATTREAEYFFTVLPDGQLGPAFRFALVSELLAITSFVAVMAPAAVVMAPQWVRHLIEDEQARDIVFRMIALGIPALALLLVAAHVLHGLALNRGAKREGFASESRRAIRFGLYAAGWDLMTSPIGLLVFAYREGPKLGVAGAFQIGGLPTRSARAFLLGAYGIEGQRARRALRVAIWGAVIATTVGSIAFLGFLAMMSLA